MAFGLQDVFATLTAVAAVLVIARRVVGPS